MLIKNTVPVKYSNDKKVAKINEFETKLSEKVNGREFKVLDLENREGKDKSLYIRMQHITCGHEFHTTSTKFFNKDTLVCPECNCKDMGQLFGFDSLLDFIKDELSDIEVIPSKYIINIPKFNLSILYYDEDKDNYESTDRLVKISVKEWTEKTEIAKANLLRIFNKSNTKKIYASTCKIGYIDELTVKNFLDTYSIENIKESDINIGLYYINGKYEPELVSVLTFKTLLDDNKFELCNFCSMHDKNIIGAFGKMLKSFKENYVWDEIYTSIDLNWNDIDKNIYLTNGFLKNSDNVLSMYNNKK